MFRIIKVERLAKAERQCLSMPRNAIILTVMVQPVYAHLMLITEHHADPSGDLGTLEILLLAPNNECDLDGWTYVATIHET